MGSFPICSKLLCCSSKGMSIPKSDLFVPQISLAMSKKNSQKKIKSLKTYNLNKNKLGFGRMTTERFISSNPNIKNSITMKTPYKNQEKSKFSKKEPNPIKNSSMILAKDNSKDIQENFDRYRSMKLNSENKLSSVNEFNVLGKSMNLNYEVSEHILSSIEEMNIINILLYHYLFHKISKDNLQYIIDELKEFQVEAGTPIFVEGDEGSCMFIIKNGQVELSSGDVESNKKIILEDGNIFGELALVQEDNKRTYNATALTGLKFYSLDKSDFFEIQNNFINPNSFEFNLFKYISDEDKMNLKLLTTSLEFKKDQNITDLNGLFWIRSGNICLCDLNNNEKDTYSTNEFIGVEKLKQDECSDKNCNNQKNDVTPKSKFNCKLIAKEDVLCTVIPEFAFIEVFGIEYKMKIYKSYLRETISKNKTFQIISDHNKTGDICQIFNIKEYRKGDNLTKTDGVKKILIIIEGKAYTEEGNGTKKLIHNSGQILGEELFYNFEQKNYIVESNHMICLECDMEDFLDKTQIFGKNLNKLINELNKIYFFNGMSILKLIDLSRNVIKITHEKDYKIIKKGDKVEDIYFVIEGSVKFIEDEQVFKEYHQGTSFGEIFLFNGKPAKVEIIVDSTKCVLYKMKKEYYFELLTDIEMNKRTKKNYAWKIWKFSPGGFII